VLSSQVEDEPLQKVQVSAQTSRVQWCGLTLLGKSNWLWRHAHSCPGSSKPTHCVLILSRTESMQGFGKCLAPPFPGPFPRPSSWPFPKPSLWPFPKPSFLHYTKPSLPQSSLLPFSKPSMFDVHIDFYV